MVVAWLCVVVCILEWERGFEWNMTVTWTAGNGVYCLGFAAGLGWSRVAVASGVECSCLTGLKHRVSKCRKKHGLGTLLRSGGGRKVCELFLPLACPSEAQISRCPFILSYFTTGEGCLCCWRNRRIAWCVARM